ncbi:MAG: glucosamine-6-phosphate deaminase, partial [Chloroflexota bacterium]|nr:glucosamine-6-phosphate deaminase [Chloroflexota bacterium]
MATASEFALTVVPDEGAMANLAADELAEVVARSPEAAITVPTGTTPLGMFDELVARVRRGEVDLSRLHVYCLDENLGVGPDDPNSLTGWLRRAFLEPAGIDPARVHALPATDSDPVAATSRYEAELAARGGLELAMLGLGPNGHVAYNEPGSAADSRTRVVELTPQSIEQASAYWEGAVPIPGRALTVGVGTLLEARRIVLIVSGEGKAEVLRRALQEPPSADLPASWLRLAGDRLRVIVDEAAASRLG